MQEIVRLAGERGKIVGAGTIIAIEQVERAAELRRGICRLARHRPGRRPRRAGARHPDPSRCRDPCGGAARRLARVDLAQAFPAEWLGVGSFRQVRGPFRRCASSRPADSTRATSAAFLDAGIRDAAVGSALEDPHGLEALAGRARAAHADVARSRSATTDFLLDGRPHRIISGAIHYFRVHPDQWADRIRKARLMGLNTIETYVAWNAHEPRRGEWDATGWNDLGRFLDLDRRRGDARDRAARALHLRRVAQRRPAGLAHRRRRASDCAAPSRSTSPR